jgi:hypothetical protein
MKSHHEDTPVSLLRRRLLCSLPSGLALATPLSLLGCGGGDGEAPPAAAEVDADDATVREVVARLPAFTRTAQATSIVLPAGSGIELSQTHVVTANNVSQVAADGTAGAVLLNGAPQMAYLFDTVGRLLLMGIVEPDANTRIDSHTTAEALILLASEVALAGDVPELALREALRTHAIVEPVQRAVEAALGRNGIDDADVALAQAVEDVLRAMRRLPPRGQTRATRERALGVRPLPDTARSGITVEPGPDYNTVQLRNAFRRRTHAWVSRIGYLDADGNQVQLPAPEPVQDFALKSTTALSFDNVVILVGDLVAGLAADIGAIDPYQSGNGFWAPVTSKPLALAMTPTEAQVTVYQARVVGVAWNEGSLPMTGAQAARFEELLGETLWEDIVLPLVKTVILPLISNRISATYKNDFKSLTNALLLAATFDMAKLEVSGKYFPETVQALRAGDANTLLTSFWKEFFGSGVFKKLLETALKATIAATPIDVLPVIRDGNGTLMGVNLLPQKEVVNANVDKLSAALTKLSRYVMAVKAALTVGDYAAMAKDWVASARVESFDINVTKARIALTPDPLVAVALAGEAGKAAVTATVQDLDGLFNTGNVFLQWKCTGRNGNLFRRGGEGTNDFESPLGNATHDYFPAGAATPTQDADTITVSAFYRDTATNKRIEMGSVSVPVHIRGEFSLSIAPASGADVPADNTVGVSAAIKEPLPKDATVDWEWSHAGVGTLRSGPADANPNESSALLDTGSSGGVATITVRAKVNLPATSTTAARSVSTHAVSVTLHVKKGLKTLTLQGSWTQDVKYTPFLCGRCGPGGSNIELIAYWVSAYLVIPKVSGAKGYSVLVEKATPDPLHAIPYPHTRTLDPARPGAGWEDRGGAWWSGLSAGGGSDINDGHGIGPYYSLNNSRFGDLKITVTVTLP